MIVKSMKKILSGIVVAAYLVVYTAPIGMCVATMPKINAGIQKPALRDAVKPTSLKLEGDISLTKGNPKISLSLRDSDVRQVLRMFADKSGLNIIFHDSASGKVTLDLVNVPLNDAFRMVMQVTNLTYYIDNNTMVVISANASQLLDLSKQEMTTIPVKYADAAVLADFMNKNIFSRNKPGLSNALVAITNPGTNEILIFGTKNDYLMAKKIVNQFDVKPREETFTVNHTTPKEMSEMICGLLFREFKSQTSSQGNWTGANSSGTAGANSESSTVTAANTSNNASSSTAGSGTTTSGTAASGTTNNTGGTSNEDNDSVSAVTLGGGVTQCRYQSSVAAGSLTSLNTPSMSVSYFPQRGTIQVLGGSAQQMEMIKEFIAKNDKKQPQAYLELSIIELSETGSREFNNTWNMYSGFFSGTFNGSTTTNPSYPAFIQGDQYTSVPSITTLVTNAITGVTSELKTPATIIKKYTDAPTVTYTMSYLIKNGKGRVLANPKIMITNGENSKIDLSSDYVKQVTSQIVTTSGSLTPTVQKTYTIGDDEGIIIEMVPFISPEGYVTLNIKPEYSTIKQEVKEMNPATNEIDLVATLLQRRNLDLKNIRIKDGETLAIGGMMREVETKSVSKFPVLGDLPGIGMFFRNTSSTKEKQELVIMITPKIIKDSEDVVNNSGVTL